MKTSKNKTVETSNHGLTPATIVVLFATLFGLAMYSGIEDFHPADLLAQTTTTSAINPPHVIGYGVDEPNNQIYLIWSEPVRKLYPDRPADGVTIFINNVQRPAINGGAETGNYSVETFTIPIGYDIAPDDLVKIAYTPGQNPIMSQETGTVGLALPVTTVTNGLDGDTSCPTLQTNLIKRPGNNNIFLGYFDERISSNNTSFQSFGGSPSIRIGITPAQNSISLSMASNIATKILEPKTINWNNNLIVNIGPSTTITDTNGNPACTGDYQLSYTTLLPEPTLERMLVTRSSETGISESGEVLPTANIPSITKIESNQESGRYPVGTTLGLTATTSIPLATDSYAVVELSTGSKKVRLTPERAGSNKLIGSYVVTSSMITNEPAKITNITDMKLVDFNNPNSLSTDPYHEWLTIDTEAYTFGNIPNANIFFVE